MLLNTTGWLTAFSAERDALNDVPNAFGYQRIFETSTNGYLVRQFFHSSLYDRMRFVLLGYLLSAILNELVPAHSWKTSRRSGSHTSCSAPYEIPTPAISIMGISRRKTF